MNKKITAYISLLLLLSCILGALSACRPVNETPTEYPTEEKTEGKAELPTEDLEGDEVTYPHYQKIDITVPSITATTMPAKGLTSFRGMLVNTDTNEMLSCLNPDAKMYPAGLTSIMALIVIAEQIPTKNTDNELITITEEHISESEGLGSARFLLGEKATVTDLIYAMVFTQDATATVALADKLCGGHDKLVELMNEKADELGLNEGDTIASTHFDNATGAASEAHYSTVRDMTAIMLYASKNEFCLNVLSQNSYTLSALSTHAEKSLDNAFLSSELNDGKTQPDSVNILAGLMTYSTDAGYCLASYATDKDGNTYVAVTSYAKGTLAAVLDHFYLYNDFAHRVVGTGVGNIAPDLEIDTYAGEKIKLSDYAGKVVVINFWGTWCSPCKSELPHFDEAANEYADDVVILTVHSNQDSSTAVEYMNTHFPDTKMIIAKDTSTDAVYKALDGSGAYPFTVIVNADGIITLSKDGALDYETLTSKIEEALNS